MNHVLRIMQGELDKSTMIMLDLVQAFYLLMTKELK